MSRITDGLTQEYITYGIEEVELLKYKNAMEIYGCEIVDEVIPM